MNVTKTVQELLLSKDKDNYKIASQILKTYPNFIITTLFVYEEEDPLDLYWGDGDCGNGYGGGSAAGGILGNTSSEFYGNSYGNGLGDSNGLKGVNYYYGK